MKILFDLFPILLFFVAYKFAGIWVATAVAIVASLAQIAWVALRHRKVDPMLWVSTAIIVVFGGATLLLHDDMFIKWKTTVFYWLLSLALLAAQFVFRKNLIKTVLGKEIDLPQPVWSRLNLAWVVFSAFLGALNLYVAYHYKQATWVSFKSFGETGILFVFIIAQSVWLARYIDEKEQEKE
jgi:intracellular septation protein